ncbi:MAG: alkaline phosphatase family protein [Proteobacteria bacterium]|nr:alkaline phosphatase family protein [Pseudomonadota bacterium]MBU1685716.1 alkaline phosphatase family protein [Pseudomonadota bacterium]
MAERLAKKVLLIGWDAADWKIIHPLLDSGKMPALEKLINRGVMGNLATLDPPMSPMLWTSIATGKRADKHGILNFTEPRPNLQGIRPISVTSRKCKAVWNILMQSGLQCNVVGWWPSHPAEPLNGVTVSNSYHRASGLLAEPWPLLPNSVHPPRMETILKELRVHPEELTEAHLLPFVPKAAEIDQDKDRRLFSVAKILAECATDHAAATWIMENEPWDFMAVYFDAIDHFCHSFMNYHPPRLGFVPEPDFELYREVVAAGYRFHDMMLARLIELAGPDTTVILVSDHGFHSDHLRPLGIPDEPAGPAHEHRPYGIIAMQGPAIAQDELIFGSSLLDIAPTILTLFGLPVGLDMDGKPLVQAFTEPVLPETIASWEAVAGECGQHPVGLREDPLADQEAMRQLIDLGYIDPPDDDIHKAIEATVDESDFYLARVHLERGAYQQALPLLEQLYEKYPEKTRYAFYLAQCYHLVGQMADCRRVVDDIFARNDQEFPHLDLLLGSVLLAENQLVQALEHLLKAEKAEPRLPKLHNQIGNVYLGIKLWRSAEAAFLKGLTIDQDCAHLHHGLATTYLKQGRYQDAVDEALTAVGLLYHYPAAHNLLGQALVALDMPDRAAEAFEVCLVMAPGFVKVRQRLIKIYDQVLARPDKVTEHRVFLSKLGKKGSKPAPITAKQVPISNRSNRKPRKLTTAEAITVVSGLPRSGTSMLMRMLAMGGMEILNDNDRQPDRDNPNGYYEYGKVKNLFRDNSWLAEAQGKAIKVIAQLLPALPQANQYRVIFIERHLDEVMCSQEKMLAANSNRVSRTNPAILAQTFHRQIDKLKTRLERQENIAVLYVSYSAIILDPHHEAVKICDFLGLDLSVAQMSAAVDPTLYRNRAKALDIPAVLAVNTN